MSDENLYVEHGGFGTILTCLQIFPEISFDQYIRPVINERFRKMMTAGFGIELANRFISVSKLSASGKAAE
jgi:hypothetical protein